LEAPVVDFFLPTAHKQAYEERGVLHCDIHIGKASLCAEKKYILDAMQAFNLTFMFAHQNSKSTHLLLIKARLP
jgi:hypothetical protein